MSLLLGESFRLPDPLPAPPQPDPNDLRIELVLEALESLRSSLNMLPAPQVTIDAPDLSAIVNAVNGLRPGVVDPDEIGRAVANALIPMRPDAANVDWQERLVTALEKLDYRMKGIGSGGTVAPANPDVADRPARLLGHVQVDNFPPPPAQQHVLVDPGSYVSDTFAAKIGQGKARIGGATVTTTAVNPNASYSVENPAGNTRVVYVVGFDCYIDTGSASITYRTGGTTPNPSVGTLFNPNRATSAPSAAIVHAGNVDPTGFTTEPIGSRLTSGSPLKLAQLVILPPGSVFGIRVTGAATGTNITANGFLYEE